MSVLDRIFPAATKAAAATPAEAGIQKVGTQQATPRRAADAAGLIDAYRRSELAYACIGIKRKAMQDPRLVVEARAADGEWKEVPDHPAQRLLLRPMPASRTSAGMDGATFIGLMVASRDIVNVAYAEKVRSKAGAVVALNPLNPRYMSPWIDRAGANVGWEWKRGTQREFLPHEDVLVWQQPDWGDASPLQVALGALDADTAQTDFIRAFFNNGGQPGGIIKTDVRTQEQADAVADKFQAKYGRNGNGWFRPAVFNTSAEYQRIGSLLNELDSESIRGLSESRICMAFGVPPLIVYAYVGLLRATYSNLKEAWASFWDAELSPMLKAYREWLTWALLTEFVSEDLIYAGRIRLRWDLSQVAALQDDVDAVHKRAADAFKVGGVTLNEYRAQIGQQPDAAGDYYVRTMAQVAEPAGQAPAAEPTPAKALRLLQTKAKPPQAIERRVEAAVTTYLRQQYRAAAEAVREGA